MSGIGSILRSVAREKSKATGMEWRRLHRIESMLTLAMGRIRSMGRHTHQLKKKRANPLHGSGEGTK
jgi:hypothetical protein